MLNLQNPSLIKDVEVSTNFNSCEILMKHINKEKSKLRRYNTYTLTLMDFTTNFDANDVAVKLQTFIRKSDSVFACGDKIYIFFPFTRYDSKLKEKIENKVLTHLRNEFKKEVKFITTKFYGFEYNPKLRDEEFPLIS